MAWQLLILTSSVAGIGLLGMINRDRRRRRGEPVRRRGRIDAE